eukprot:GHUV01032297.1.p2 GENE.GHUV01032297.1~~GHUV01032297.1.p2  ORF type:complete len:113 (+),score=13.87 GHUV01032297.1:142-480(+)
MHRRGFDTPARYSKSQAATARRRRRQIQVRTVVVRHRHAIVADVDTHSVCRGLLGTCMTIAREEGAGALWKGLEPGDFRVAIHEATAEHTLCSCAAQEAAAGHHGSATAMQQ